ncbi:hypothetical protein A3J41_02540 [candidate division TM6 bacterium RIFCSPHIGHO2_12_FULL_38_8]|nr:MAG: hypothetical protein A3J41_02540 [candidate division TM6 bacterium RIFCSPHIGHO2_12_FULL_38_8]
MVHQKSSLSDKKLLTKLSDFSKNLTQHHHLENLSEFLLHDVCAADLFAVPKAAYLVNNPDFSCLKGVAGYHIPESFIKGDHWNNQKAFTSHMKSSQFNQKVRSVQDKSLVLEGKNLENKKIYGLADQLEIHDPLYHIWRMKHDNQGVLIFERPQDFGTDQEHLLRFLYMLSFCPVF